MYDPADDPQLRVIRPLGEGGTATVVLAYHTQLNREVAVKYGRTPDADSKAGFSRLICREFDLISGYRFPGLVKPLLPPSPTKDYLILEFCPGPTLNEVGRIDNVGQALNIISAIAADLEFLRAAGLVHGDLKPHNVFLPQHWSLLKHGQLFFVKLSDLSLGRRLAEPETTRLGLGTVGYMAPEIILHRRTSLRSDLFALGVIAYQLLSGRHPFMDDDSEPVKVNGRICEQEPAPLSELRPELPDTVCHLVSRLLDKNEESRPESGWEICEELGRRGASYPYRRLLRPGSMIRRDTPFPEAVQSVLSLSDKERKQIDTLTDENPERLRLLLTANFVRGNLTYDRGRFRFESRIYWPSLLRRQTLQQYSKTTWREKKTAVLTAVAGLVEDVDKLGLRPEQKTSSIPHTLSSLLLPLLRSRTVARVSARFGPLAERQKVFNIATRMHVQAGKLEEAERCAELAAHEFTLHDCRADALSMLLAVDRYARTLKREFDVRRVLLLKANIHKDSGELDVAEKAYRRIIGLYESRPADKLLAESYKYLGDLFRMRQDIRAALDALEKSLAVFRELGDDLETSHTLTNIGNVHWIANDTRQARRRYRQAYRIQERLDAKPDLASTLHNIATTYCFDGRCKRGIFLLNHALELKKELGNLGEIARTLNNLGYAYQMMGLPAKAAESLTESLDINRRIGSKKEVLYNLENLISLRIAAGQLAAARELLDESLALSDSLKLTSHEATFYLYAVTIAKRQGRFADAAQALARIDKLLDTLDDPSLGLLASVQKASVKLHLGDAASALEIVRDIYDESVRTSNSIVELESLLLLTRLSDQPAYWDAAGRIVNERRLVREKRMLDFGRIEYLLDRGNNAEAASLTGVDFLGVENDGEDLELPWMRIIAARVCIAQHDPDRARRLLEKARQQAQEAQMRPEVISSLTLLGQIAREQGAYEGAYSSFKQALSVCREVAASISVEVDRNLYLGRPVVQALSEGIRSLGQKLGQKARADR